MVNWKLVVGLLLAAALLYAANQLVHFGEHNSSAPQVASDLAAPFGNPHPPRLRPLVAKPPSTNARPRTRRADTQASELDPAMEDPESEENPDEEQEAEVAETIVPLPIARQALSFVGVDRSANEIWLVAINDPALSPDERKDLIEDLNEEGFPDPRNITQDDLPLILSRLALIEQFAPDSMDEVNEAAFAEAYRDLSNMFARLAQQWQQSQP